MSLRKITKNRAAFPSDEAVLKLVYLALFEYQPKMDDVTTELESRSQPV